jgi:hypothetical protein
MPRKILARQRKDDSHSKAKYQQKKEKAELFTKQQ